MCPEINEYCSVLFSRRVHAGQYCIFIARDKKHAELSSMQRAWKNNDCETF